MTTASRRALLLAGARAALSGCGVQTWIKQPGRHIFRPQTLYIKANAGIRAVAPGHGALHTLELGAESTEVSGAVHDLCRVDLDGGKATPLRRVERAQEHLAISNSCAWLVMKSAVTGEPYLYRAPLAGPGAPEKLFRVPPRTFLIADGQGAWTYRATSRSKGELVRATEAAVETITEDTEPGELTLSAHGVFFDIDSGLHFFASGGKPTRVAERAAIPLVGGDRALLSIDQRIFELDPETGVQGKLIGDASSVPGRPCAALFGGVLFADEGSASTGLSRSAPGSIDLNFWEADKPGRDTAMDASPGPMLFGAAYGPSCLIATASSIISLS